MWSMYQRANALFSLDRFSESLALYESVAVSRSNWAEEAGAGAESARLELRVRDEPTREARNAG